MTAAQEILILIVDDRQHNLFALEQTLKDVPAKIIKATSGDEALALSLKYDFALALLDVQMPGMDGYELAELLLGNPSTSSVPIIFVSAAYGDEAHRFKGYQTGAVDYLVKPVDPVVLRGKVRVFLELARMRVQLQTLVQERTQALNAKAAQIVRRNAFRSLLSDISKDLIGQGTSNTQAGVATSLGKVADFIGASHAFALIPGTGQGLDRATTDPVEWNAEEAGRIDGRSGTSVIIPMLLEWDAFRRGDGLLVESLDALPASAAEAREHLDRLGVRCLLLLPIVEDGIATGAVGFDWRTQDAANREDLAELLTLFTDMVLGTVRRAEAELQRRASQEQHRVLFETMAQGVVYQDASGTILAANPAAERVLGLSFAQMSGRDSMDPNWRSIHEDGSDFPGHEHPAMVSLRTGESVHNVMMGVFNPKNEAYRWLMVDAVPMFRPGESKPSLVYTTFSDLTELKTATAEKQRLVHIEAESKAKSRFLASMSHEIRTPMNAMLGYTQLLLREPGLGARQREYLETIDRSGEHLLTIINNVLDMARIESGADNLDVAVADFGDVLTDMERMFRLRAVDKGLAFRIVRSGIMPRRLRIDAGKVRQVLINLLGNAMKFTPSGSVTLRSTVTPVPGQKVHVVLEVQDTGIGIATHQVEDIFEPFMQIAPGATKSGTGLGLAVSRRFAKLMDGDVSVTSIPGEGSTFRFEFEAQRADGETTSSTTPRAIGLTQESPKIRVLLVEDDTDNRLMLTRMLNAVGLSVRDASNADDAVATFAREPCEIVLTDMKLPGADGIDVMQRIRNLPGGDRVPVVAVSASALRQDREHAMSAGVDGFVGKPVRESGVFREIARLTGAKFQYAEEGRATIVPAAAPLTETSLGVVPAEQRNALIEALQGGYLDAIATEIDNIERLAPSVAKELRRLANAFEYTTLFELLGRVRDNP